jgi:hypothetical protein
MHAAHHFSPRPGRVYAGGKLTMPEGNSTPPKSTHAKSQDKQTTTSAEAPMLDGVNEFFDLSAKSTEALVRSGEVMFKAMESVGREIIDFTDKRVRAVSDVTQSVARCNTWSEAYELQTKHARSALEAYAAEARTLLDISAKASKDGLAPIEQHARTSLRL